MSAPFTSLGKEVLANGVHYADAVDVTAAKFIAEACNVFAGRTPPTDREAA